MKVTCEALEEGCSGLLPGKIDRALDLPNGLSAGQDVQVRGFSCQTSRLSKQFFFDELDFKFTTLRLQHSENDIPEPIHPSLQIQISIQTMTLRIPQRLQDRQPCLEN